MPDERFAYAAETPSLGRHAAALAREVVNLAYDHLELAALEARRAATSLARMLSAAVVVSLLVTTAWLALVASAIVWATDTGIGWPLALIIAAVVNLVLAAGVVFWIRGHVDELLFAATLRQLRRTTAEAKEEAR